QTPEKIFKEVIDPVVGLTPFQARRLAFNIHIPEELLSKAVKFMMGLYDVFIEKDCSVAEINPLVTTGDGQVLALDCKLNFDDNALYRQQDLLDLRDLDEEDEKEIEASKHDLSYIVVGGGSTAEKVTEAFKFILSDTNVKGIFVNIFGGIMKCDVIAEGVVEATKQVGLDLPLVVRLEGTNVELGKKILNDSGLN